MRPVKFMLKLESPLAYSIEDCHYQEQFIFPGSLLRGALVPLYLNMYGKDDFFQKIFISGDNRFPFLFPANDKGEPIAKAPLTASACKRHGIDHKVVSYISDLWNEPEFMECSTCQNDLKSYKGFLAKNIPLERSLMAHTAIHPETHTSLPHAYYREFLISPKASVCNYHVCGYGYLCDESFQRLTSLCHNNMVMLGKSCSRGKGWGKLTIEEKEPEILREKEQTVLSKNAFTLHCKSPVILLDKFLRPTTELSLVWQGKALEPDKWKADINCVNGWSTIHALPKVEDVAIEMGSVYVYQREGELLDDKVFAEFVTHIEKEGIGERRIEGFGQVSINEKVVTHPGEYIIC